MEFDKNRYWHMPCYKRRKTNTVWSKKASLSSRPKKFSVVPISRFKM